MERPRLQVPRPGAVYSSPVRILTSSQSARSSTPPAEQVAVWSVLLMWRMLTWGTSLLVGLVIVEIFTKTDSEDIPLTLARQWVIAAKSHPP